MTVFNRHRRFLVAFAFGTAVALATFALPIRPELRALAGVDAFCLAYLALMFQLARNAGAEALRRASTEADEGIGLILLLALTAVTASLTAILLVLNGPEGTYLLACLLALGSVPLGWAMVQVLAGFHYAHMFYLPDEGEPHGGLDFPGTKTPNAWDFLYFSFVIGMTAQVSDVVVTTGRMRRAVLLHSITAFFYNTVLLALAVNAAVNAAQ